MSISSECHGNLVESSLGAAGGEAVLPMPMLIRRQRFHGTNSGTYLFSCFVPRAFEQQASSASLLPLGEKLALGDQSLVGTIPRALPALQLVPRSYFSRRRIMKLPRLLSTAEIDIVEDPLQERDEIWWL